MPLSIGQVLQQHGVPHSAVATALGVARSTVTLKVSGTRRWSIPELLELHILLTDAGSRLSLEQLARICIDEEE